MPAFQAYLHIVKPSTYCYGGQQEYDHIYEELFVEVSRGWHPTFEKLNGNARRCALRKITPRIATFILTFGPCWIQVARSMISLQ